MIFAQRLKELRIESELTQVQLAEKVGCNQSMIARWEKGECEPTLSSLVKLSEILN
ncbi:MAG: helix-turn-helix domain-containing protein, partial [Clostridia bacterium]|nr:helix-turn-helix domain-containing protein [Clostridia bacterium]